MSRSQQRPDPLRTEADELFYDEYVNRRDRQRGDLRSRRSNNDRLPPLPRTADSLVSLTSRPRRQQTAASDRSLRTSASLRSINTVVSEKQPNFKREGYEQLNSRLGDDPLTAVRLMRAQLAQMSLRDRLNERDVKSQFARDAGQALLKAEHELEQMQRRRTDAIINGDTLEARRINRMMQDVRAKGTYDAYADLLFNEQQLASYGVRSKYAAQKSNRRSRNNNDYSPRRRRNYTPDERRRTVDTSRERSRRHSYEDRSFSRYIHTPPNAVRTRHRDRHRPFSEDSLRSVPQTGTQHRSQSNRKGSKRREKTTVKKNKRLADIKFPQPKTPPPKPPKTPPTDVPPTPNGEPGVCPQCYERNPALMSEEGLKNHWGNFCACLTRCQYCDQVIHVSDLNNHHINQCQFVRGTLKPCPLCGIAQYQGNVNHPNCQLKPPPPGAAWCPLCSRSVKPFSSKDAWRKHLIDECYNNPRNSKRWSGKYAPSNGSSLLGSLNGQVIEVPTGLNQNQQAPVGNAPAPTFNNAPTNRPQLNGPTQNAQPANGANQNAQRAAGGPMNPNNLRDAYNKLREERRDDYIRQQQLDKAAEQEKEEEDV